MLLIFSGQICQLFKSCQISPPIDDMSSKFFSGFTLMDSRNDIVRKQGTKGFFSVLALDSKYSFNFRREFLRL
jgi:hypothetical protein